MNRKSRKQFREFLRLVKSFSMDGKELKEFLGFGTDSREVSFANFIFNFREEYTSLKLMVVKYFLHHLSLLEYLVENEISLKMLSGLDEILQASPSPEHHILLEKMDNRLFEIPSVPVASELKVLAELGLETIGDIHYVDNLDSSWASFSHKPYDYFYYKLSYNGLAHNFYYIFKENWLIISKQHIIGIKIYSTVFKIPKSINLLTKLKILIIDNRPEEGELSDYLIPPLGTIPNEITQLTKLRILYLINSGLAEFPKEFTQLSKMRDLYVSNSTFQIVPNLPNIFPKLRSLRLEGVPLKKSPAWLYEFARVHHSRNYIETGVNEEDAAVLGLLEIISGPLEWAKYDDDDYYSLWGFHGYHTNELGRVTKLRLGWLTYYSKDPPFYGLLYFPEEINKLQQLEKLYICNCKYSKIRTYSGSLGWGFFPPQNEQKAEAWIPDSIRELKSLRYLWSNAKYSESLKPFLESLKKFDTNVFINEGLDHW